MIADPAALDFDYAAYNRDVIEVAERHVRQGSPEFAAWLDGRLTPGDAAAIFGAMYATPEHRAIVANRWRSLVDEFTDYVHSCPREFRRELRGAP